MPTREIRCAPDLSLADDHATDPMAWGVYGPAGPRPRQAGPGMERPAIESSADNEPQYRVTSACREGRTRGIDAQGSAVQMSKPQSWAYV